MQFSRCAQVEALWWALRRNGAPPRRRDITAARLGEALSHVFILDAPGQDGLRFRLVGSALHQAAGIDLTAMPFTALFTDSWFGTAKALCRTALCEGATLRLKVCSEAGAWGQLCLFPLSNPNRRQLLGCLEMAQPGAVLLNALTIESSHFTRAPGSVRLPASAPAPRRRPVLQPSGMAEAPAQFKGADKGALKGVRAGWQRKRPDAQRPALRIVSSSE
ncbi:PAS domain-containing protein [Pseudoruegeria aquimaris]|nr:PAS domain-containing protein [Pseudoruegeria aquimaris]